MISKRGGGGGGGGAVGRLGGHGVLKNPFEVKGYACGSSNLDRRWKKMCSRQSDLLDGKVLGVSPCGFNRPKSDRLQEEGKECAYRS